MNHRPLSYYEDDLQVPTLTLNTLILGKTNYLSNEDPSEAERKDLRNMTNIC